jgi:hypothetical protein
MGCPLIDFIPPASIRAYGAQGPFIEESLRRINKYTRAARTLSNLDRWMGVRLAAVGNILAALLATYLVYFHKVHSPGIQSTGLSQSSLQERANNVGFGLSIAGKYRV